MSDQLAQQNKPTTLKEFLGKEDIKKRFADLLKGREGVFMTSIMQIASSNEMLKKADPTSIINAALTAATLDLPLNNSLGFAYIVPFNSRDNGVQAQFILGSKGFIQLAQRSGQFKTLSCSEIYDGQIVKADPLQGYEFDFTQKASERIVGYAAYFKLNNGFEATWYMTIEQLEKHAKKYSQTYKSGFGVWKDNFDSMAKKTVIKLLLSKFAPLSVEMQKAIQADQSIVKETEDGEFEYIDNEKEALKTKSAEEHELERFEGLIKIAKNQKDIDNLKKNVPDELLDTLLLKEQEITQAAKK